MNTHTAGRRSGIALLLLLLLDALGAGAGRACAAPPAEGTPSYPVHSRRVDGSLLAAGATTLAVSFLVGQNHETVPPEGRDPSTIG